jgi:hypothetical protein
MPAARTFQAARGAWLATTFSVLLAACGGGSDPSSTPQIEQFSADRAQYFVGERARLAVQYRGGSGRIEPGIGPVASGSTIETPALADGVSYRLIVESPQGATSRALSLDVAFRNRYVALSAPFRSARHAAVLTGDGSVLLIGGSRAESTLSYGIDRFDPATGTFTRVGLLQVGRELHRATRLADGRILVTGGGVTSLEARAAELIDERTGASTRIADALSARIDHTATLLADGRVLLAGGATSGSGVLISDTAEIWDPATGQFRLVGARMNTRRMSHTATLLADGRVLLAGGFSSSASYAPAEVFDPATERFTAVSAPVALQRGLHSAHRLADGSVLIVGGDQFDPVTGTTSILSTALRFDPATSTLAAAPALASPRSAVSSLRLPDDRILMFGGIASPTEHAASAEAYHPARGSQPLAPLPSARAWQSVTRLADGRVLIVGGESADGDLLSQALLYE